MGVAAAASGSARAEGPTEGEGAGDPADEIRRLSIAISKALRENEEALSRLARGEKGDPKPVHIHLPGGS